MSTVKLKYSAMSNITFHGEVETHVSWEEWREMDHRQRGEIMTDALFELVDIHEGDDPGEDNEVGDQGA